MKAFACRLAFGRQYARALVGAAVLFGAAVLPGAGQETLTMTSTPPRTVLMIIAPSNFRDEELFTPMEVFRKAGLTVTLAATRKEAARGMLGGIVMPDGTLDQAHAADFDAVVFVGGAGASAYFKDARAHQIARDAVEAGRVVGAICVAPAILANAGVLKGRKVACFSSVTPTVRAGGGEVQKTPVVTDGRLITADGPAAAAKFADAIVHALSP